MKRCEFILCGLLIEPFLEFYLTVCLAGPLHEIEDVFFVVIESSCAHQGVNLLVVHRKQGNMRVCIKIPHEILCITILNEVKDLDN